MILGNDQPKPGTRMIAGSQLRVALMCVRCSERGQGTIAVDRFGARFVKRFVVLRCVSWFCFKCFVDRFWARFCGTAIPKPSNLKPEIRTLNFEPETRNLTPQTQNLQRQTSTPNTKIYA